MASSRRTAKKANEGWEQTTEAPGILGPEEFERLAAAVKEPFRTMVMVAGCLGLRVSEIVGLQWGDFDFENHTVLVQRGVVHGYVGDVKTEYSKDHLPLDPLLVDLLGQHRERCYPTAEGWLFANPATGKPYHQEQIQKNHLTKAATAAKIKGESVGTRSGTAIVPGWMIPELRLLSRSYRWF